MKKTKKPKRPENAAHTSKQPHGSLRNFYAANFFSKLAQSEKTFARDYCGHESVAVSPIYAEAARNAAKLQDFASSADDRKTQTIKRKRKESI
jgi:hypothetical protein